MSIRQGRRVAFMGAGGTGKTTSAKFITEKTGLPLFKSASRVVYEKKKLTEEQVKMLTPEEKLVLQLDIFEAKARQDREFTYVADRSVLDHYCYCLAYCGNFMTDSVFNEYEEKVRTLMMSTYTHLFYFPWGYWEAAPDGVRSESQAWQSQIDAIMSGYILRWDLPVVEVPQTLGVEQRNEFILETLEQE